MKKLSRVAGGFPNWGKIAEFFSDLEMFPRSGAELHFPDDQISPIAEFASGKFGSGILLSGSGNL